MIRKVELKDESYVYELLCELEETKFPKDKFHSIFLNDIHNTNHICYVYEEKGEALGMIHMRIEMQWHHMENVCEVLELVVSHSARSKGIGKQLLDEAVSYAKSIGCEYIELTTNQKRKRAHLFYEKNGFTQSHYKYTLKLTNQ